MRIGAAFPVTSMEGKTKKLSFFTTSEGIFSRERGPVTNPNTLEQQKIRQIVTAAARNWQNLTQLQRDGWQEYAQQFYTENSEGDPIRPQGMPTYVRANVVRSILGQPFTTGAPLNPPPSGVTDMVSEMATSENEFTFTLTHAHATVTGLQVLVKITPAMSSPARTPRLQDLRLIRGVDSDSAFALVVSGGSITIAGARFLVPDGIRFGGEARIVRTVDGISSPPFFIDAVHRII